MRTLFCGMVIVTISFLSAFRPTPCTTFMASSSLVPFDVTNPVLYDNDDHRDMYTDEYLLSLASAGVIQLKGIITTYSADAVEYDLFVKGRQHIIQTARQSGLTHLPAATAGPQTRLVRPASNQIRDTKPLICQAGQVIVKAALKASPAKPLVIITGGQLTAVADAYLQNPKIADRVIVSGIFGVRDQTYNAGLDAWAWAIVIRQFRCFSISDSDTDTAYNRVFKTACPQTPKQQFRQAVQQGKLPNTPFYRWMVVKRHPRHPATYMEQDGDAPAVVSLMQPNYVRAVERWRCTGLDVSGVPTLVRDADGPLYLVTQASEVVGTNTFWQGIEDPRVWKHDKVSN